MPVKPPHREIKTNGLRTSGVLATEKLTLTSATSPQPLNWQSQYQGVARRTSVDRGVLETSFSFGIILKIHPYGPTSKVHRHT